MELAPLRHVLRNVVAITVETTELPQGLVIAEIPSSVVVQVHPMNLVPLPERLVKLPLPRHDLPEGSSGFTFMVVGVKEGHGLFLGDMIN
jgi:hypothetical protein